MKIGLISDIHCYLPGLRHAIDLLSDCDELLCSGDLMYQYRFSSEILDLLDESGVRCIVGNHDLTILHAPAHPIRKSLADDPTALERLGAIPRQLALDLGGVRIAMFHGSPWDEPDRCHYVYPNDRDKMKQLSSLEADVVVLGHTHVPFTAKAGDRLVVNSGSVGECRDGTGTLSCSVLDTSTLDVELRRFTA
jgi:putative phosphoesterase